MICDQHSYWGGTRFETCPPRGGLKPKIGKLQQTRLQAIRGGNRSKLTVKCPPETRLIKSADDGKRRGWSVAYTSIHDFQDFPGSVYFSDAAVFFSRLSKASARFSIDGAQILTSLRVMIQQTSLLFHVEKHYPPIPYHGTHH